MVLHDFSFIWYQMRNPMLFALIFVIYQNTDQPMFTNRSVIWSTDLIESKNNVLTIFTLLTNTTNYRYTQYHRM